MMENNNDGHSEERPSSSGNNITGRGNETSTGQGHIITNGLSGLNRGRSRVWNEFVITGDGTRVTCRRCGDSLSYSHSHSTSSMLKHLKRKHHMNLYPALDENDGNDGSKIPAKSPDKVKQPKKSKSKKASFVEAPAPEIPEYQEEQVAEPSIQHDPLIFVDPCVRMRWADHSDTFQKTFTVMYNDELYTDCILVAENQFFKGHRMVLSSASELLDEMFKITPAVHHPIIFLNNVKAMELRVLLDFIYKGEVAIPPNLIPGLVKVGSELKVKGLSDFVWNDQLASTIFPQGYSNQTVPQQQQTFHTSFVTEANNVKINPSYEKQSCGTEANSKPLLSTQSQMTHGPRLPSAINKMSTPIGGITPNIHKTYARLVPNVRPGGGFSSQQNLTLPSTSILDSCSPQYKRLKLLDPCGSATVSSANTSPSNSYVTTLESKKSSGNLDTVLMVTNQGETVLSTSQGGVTLMTPNSISLPVSFIKDDSSQGHHSQFVSGQPVTILSSCGSGSGHGLDEVVYSITEVPGGGHEVLMSGMDQGPIVVYDTNVREDDEPADKKLFQDEMHKS